MKIIWNLIKVKAFFGLFYMILPDLMPIIRYSVESTFNLFDAFFRFSSQSMEFMGSNHNSSMQTLEYVHQMSTVCNEYVLNFLLTLDFPFSYLILCFVGSILLFEYILNGKHCVHWPEHRFNMDVLKTEPDICSHISVVYVFFWRIVVKFPKRDAAHNDGACILVRT